MGTPAAAVPSLRSIVDAGHDVVAVYTQPDRPAGRGKRVAFSPVKELALEQGLTVLQPLKIRTPEVLSEFRSHNADAAVVVAYGRILPDEFLTAYRNGAMNVHFSLLPKYRGAAPVNWAIVNGETETGVTTMKIDRGLDTGDILLQKSVSIGEDEDSVSLMTRLAELGGELIVETLAQLDSIMPRPQDHAAATLAPILRKEDGLIDWSSSAESIRNRIRGFQPFPTSYTFFRSGRLTIWSSSVSATGDDVFREPGTIIAAAGGELVIECGQRSLLRIEELQPEGRKRMAARDFINGVRPRMGERLG